MEYDDMSPTQKHYQNRLYLTFIVASSHFVLMVLGISSRLAFSVVTRYDLLAQTLDNQLWTVLQGSCFVAIVLALCFKRGHVSALGAATGVMGAWSFLSLLWGLSTPTPVSLSGPVLGGGIATLSYLLTISWARTPVIRHRGE